MTSPKLFAALLTTSVLLTDGALGASGIDMDDPRRALGREGDVRIDAQLVREVVSPGMPIGITYQIHNLSASTIAIAHKVTEASYDSDTRTITVAIGSEVPPDGNMPQMVMIRPGEKKLLQAGATPVLNATSLRAFAATPRYVQVKVTVLRDLSPFLLLIQKQEARARHRLTDAQFDRWFESNDTIFLNSVPVQYSPVRDAEADQREARGGF